MAIIYCPDCHKEMSDTATVCPNCGYPYAQKLALYLDFRPGMGSVFLSAAQDDVEKDEDGQLHCQNDPFQIHHR